MFDNVAQWLFQNKLDELIRDTYSSAFTKGYDLGRKAGLSDDKNQTSTLGDVNIQREVEQIMEQKGF